MVREYGLCDIKNQIRIFVTHNNFVQIIMFLRKISAINFKNITQTDLTLSPAINCFTGINGAGKTNVIDAVYYLAMCKSSLGMTDGQSIRHGEEFFMLDGDFLTDGNSHESITCSFHRSSGKSLKRNSKEYDRLSEHIGVVPVVIVSPGDVFLINDAADERRKWINSFISQTDSRYLDTLIKYNHTLAERNKLLKQPFVNGADEILEVLNEQLSVRGKEINRKRNEIIGRLEPVVQEYYAVISGDREKVSLVYKSELNATPFEELLRAARAKDHIHQFTTVGVHRDDLVMKIGGYPLRKYGSQGQQKSFLIALKLAQFALLREEVGECPLLLLDDLFDKLDTERLEALITLVGGDSFGQIFISDCNNERLTSVLDSCNVEYTLFDVTDGDVSRKLTGKIE